MKVCLLIAIVLLILGAQGATYMEGVSYKQYSTYTTDLSISFEGNAVLYMTFPNIESYDLEDACLKINGIEFSSEQVEFERIGNTKIKFVAPSYSFFNQTLTYDPYAEELQFQVYFMESCSGSTYITCNPSESERCTFSYKKTSTPVVTKIHPGTVYAKDDEEVDFWIMPFESSSNKISTQTLVQSIEINKGYCNFDDYLKTWTSFDSDAPNDVTCILKTVLSDDSTSLATNLVSGDAIFPYQMNTFLTGGEHYPMRVLPYVSTISSHSGSKAGGQYLSISGYGFSRNVDDIEVTIDGELCAVDSASKNQIECTTARITQSTDGNLVFPGGHGMVWKYFKSVYTDIETFLTSTKYTTDDYEETDILLDLYTYSDKTNAVETFEGFFRPTSSGTYKIVVSTGDEVVVYMNMNGRVKADKEELIHLTSEQAVTYEDDFLSFSEQTSDELTLDGDTYYYLFIVHRLNTKSNHLKVGLEKTNTATNPSNKHNIQKVVVDSQPIRETHFFTISNPPADSDETYTWKLSLHYLEDDVYEEVLIESEDISVRATAAEFLAAFTNVNDNFTDYNTKVELTAYDGSDSELDLDSITLVSDTSVAKLTYKMIFDVPHPESALETTWFVSDVVASLPEDTTFTLSMFNYESGPQFTTKMTGFFSLVLVHTTYGSFTIGPINLGDSAEKIQFNLENTHPKLKKKIKVGMDTSINPYDGCIYYFEFIGYISDIDAMTFSTDSSETALGWGGSIDYVQEITIIQSYNTNILLKSIPYEYLFTMHDNHQLLLKSKGLLAVCQDCDYTYEAATTKITGFSYDAPSSTLTITGEAFNEATIESISFANDECTITSDSATQIVCTVTEPQIGDFQPIITAVMGIIALDETISSNIVTVDFGTLSITPSSGINPNGGQEIFISGSGFPTYSYGSFKDGESIEVVINSETLEINSASYTEISVISNVLEESSSYDMTITVNSKETTESIATGAAPAYSITSISPNTLNPVDRKNVVVTISGSGITASVESFYVTLGETVLNVLDVTTVDSTTTTVTVRYSGATIGSYNLNVNYLEAGKLTGQTTITVTSLISSITPNEISLAGGATIALSGSMFCEEMADNIVLVDDGICTIKEDSFSTSYIECQVPTQSTSEIGSIDNAEDVLLDIFLLLNVVNEATCGINSGDGCYITLTKDKTPVIQTAYVQEVSGETVIKLNGQNFDLAQNDVANIQAYIDGVQQQVFSLDEVQNEILVRFTEIPYANSGALEVIFKDVGGAYFTDTNVIEIPMQFADLAKTSGSDGGSLLILNVFGFNSDDDTTEVIAGNDISLCRKVETSFYEIKCYTNPSLSLPANGEVITILYNENAIACEGTLADCSYTQDSSSTPEASSISWGMNSGNFEITFELSNTGSCSNWKVELEDLETVDATLASTTYTAQFSSIDAGTYSLFIYCEDTNEYALISDNSVEVSFELSSTPFNVEVSFAGGKSFEIDSPVVSSANSNIEIKVCDASCPIQSNENGVVSCKIPALYSKTLVDTYSDLYSPLSKISHGTPFSDRSESAALNAFDDSYSSYYRTDNTDCYLGFELLSGMKAQLKEIRIYMQYVSDYSQFSDAKIQASADGTNYVDILEFTDNVDEGWNYFSVDDESLYTSFKLVSNGESHKSCWAYELAFYGIEYADTTDQFQCDVDVYYNGELYETYNSAVTYKESLTTYITSFTPDEGSSAGNEDVVFTGVNIDTTTSNLQISFNGIQCSNFASASSTGITCTTEVRDTINDWSLAFYSSDRGLAFVPYDKYFYFVDYWGDIDTWGGDYYPMEGDVIVIPAGQVLVLDIEETPLIHTITVEGVLIVQDYPDNPSHETKIHIRNIFINKGGQLRIGTEDDPYLSKLTITFYGDGNDGTLPIFGHKGIFNYYGVLDIHGVPRDPVWTYLNSPAEVGDDQIVVDGEVDWKAGETIFITPTGFTFFEGEVRKIKSVSIGSGISTLTLNETLKYYHHAKVDIVEGKKVSIKAEVGLLSRNILLQGDEEWSPYYEIGCQIRVYGKGYNEVIARASYIEMFNTGQGYKLDKYSFYFQSVGIVDKSYVKGCAFHNSFSRIVGMKDVAHLTIENNVVYETCGFAITLHYNMEVHNTFKDNMMTHIREGWGLTSMDHQPGCFQVLSARNSWINNHCSGARDWGWYWCLGSTNGNPKPSKVICGDQERVIQFDDNVGHSMWLGYFQDCNNKPFKYPCRPWRNATNKEDIFFHNPPDPMFANNFLAYKCSNAGVAFLYSGAQKWINGTYTDCRRGHLLEQSGWSREGDNTIQDSLFVNYFLEDESKGYYGVTTPRSELYMVINNTFVGYTHTSSAAIETCAHCNNFYLGGNMVKFKENSFVDVYRRIFFREPQKGLMVDLDGTLTGYPMYTAVPYWKHLDVPECENATVDVNYFDGLLCNSDVQLHTIQIYDPEPLVLLIGYADMYVGNGNMTFGDEYVVWTDPDTGTNVDLDNDFSRVGAAVYGAETFFPLNGWTIPVVLGYKYYLIFDYDFEAFNLLYYRIWGAENSSVIWTFHYNERRDSIYSFITDNDTLTTPNCTTEEEFYAETLSGAYYQDKDHQEFSLLLHNRDPYREAQEINIIQCFGGCEPEIEEKQYEDFVRLWSNATQWPNEEVPQDGENVEIPKEWQLLLDEDTASLKLLTIYGKLTFGTDLDEYTLTAQNIHVNDGELFIGTEEEPYSKKATINLTGNKFSMYIDDAYGLSNVLLGEGRISMVSAKQNSQPSLLLQDAAVGATEITIETGLTDWEAGDEILITSTTFYSGDFDKKTIVSYNSATGKLVVDSGLEHLHLSLSSESTEYGIATDISARVLNLNRNIIITGSEDWGATIMSRDWLQDDDVLRIGYLLMDGVRFQYGGHNASGLLLEKYSFYQHSLAETAVVKNCVLETPKGGAVNILNSTGIEMTNNFIIQPYWFGIQIMNSTDISLDGNIIVAVVDDRNVKIDSEQTLEQIIPSYAFKICTMSICNNVRVTNNIASAMYIAYSMKGDGCTRINEEVYMDGNMAHSSMIGWLLTPNQNLYDYDESDSFKQCIVGQGFTAFRCWKYGLISYFNALVTEVTNIHTVECKHGIFIINSGFYKDAPIIVDETECQRLKTHEITIIDPIMVGEVRPSSSCYLDTDLYRFPNFASVIHKSSGIILGSAHTHSKNHPPFSHDMMAIDGTMNTRSQKPEWDEKNANALPNINATIENPIFINYIDKPETCKVQTFAIISNTNETDYTPLHNFKNAQFVNVDLESLAYLYPRNPYFVGAYTCGQFECTGPTNVYVHFDPEITVDGVTMNSIISNSPSVSNKFDNCLPIETWNAYYCNNDHVGVLVFEGLVRNDVMIGDVVSSPIFILRDDGFNNTLNNEQNIFYCHDDPDNNIVYEKIPHIIMRHNRFPAIIETDKEYTIICRGTVPDTFQFQLYSVEDQDNDDDSTIIQLAYNETLSVHVYIDDQRVSNFYDYSTQLTNHGENIWFYKNNTIKFLIKNTRTRGNIILNVVDSVYVSYRLSIDLDDFYSSGGVDTVTSYMCAVLGISSSRVRVVGVDRGSTILIMTIDAESTDSDTNYAELSQISNKLTDSVKSGELEFPGMDILEFNATVSMTSEVEETEVAETKEDSWTTKDVVLVVLLAILTLGVLVGAGIIIALHYHKQKVKKEVKEENLKPEKGQVAPLVKKLSVGHSPDKESSMSGLDKDSD